MANPYDQMRQSYLDTIDSYREGGEIRRGQQARKDALSEAQANRDQRTQEQQTEIAGQRDLAADRYGYDYALQGQQQQGQADRDFRMAGIQGDQDHARYQHDDELFERQLHGRLAEQQLQQIEQERQMQFEQQGRERMAQFQAGNEQDRLGQQEDFQAAGMMFDAQQKQQEQQTQMLHQAAMAKMAQKGREAEEEILNRHRQGELSEEHGWKVDLIKQARQEEQDQHLADGLASGDYEIASPEEQRALDDNASARGKWLVAKNAGRLDDDDYQKLVKQSFAADTAIRRNARPAPPEKRSQALESRRQAAMAKLPDHEQGKPWQLDPKTGMLMLPRGWKEPPPPKPLSPPKPAAAAKEPNHEANAARLAELLSSVRQAASKPYNNGDTTVVPKPEDVDAAVEEARQTYENALQVSRSASQPTSLPYQADKDPANQPKPAPKGSIDLSKLAGGRRFASDVQQPDQRQDQQAGGESAGGPQAGGDGSSPQNPIRVNDGDDAAMAQVQPGQWVIYKGHLVQRPTK